MKSPRFHLTEIARASLKAIGRYTQKQWGKTQRDLYLRALDKQFRSLASFPMKDQPRDEIIIGLRSYS